MIILKMLVNQSMQQKNSKKDLRTKEVYQFTLDNIYLDKYKSVSVASKETGISKTGIAKVCRGIQSNSGGFIWKYNLL